MSDFYRRAVVAVAPDGTQEDVLVVDGQPGGLGWLPDGSMLVVSSTDRRLLRRSVTGCVEVVADLAQLVGGNLNDMVVDGRGRAWIGNFGYDVFDAPPALAVLVRVDPDGAATVAAEGLAFPNGSVVSPDGTTLIVGESAGRRFTAFTIGTDGSLTDRRTWADLSAAGVAPDGCCLDAAGRIWAADIASRRVVLVAPGGEILDEVRPPGELHVYACMLGGMDGRTLLLCAAPHFRQEHERDGLDPGMLLAIDVEVPRAGLP